MHHTFRIETLRAGDEARLRALRLGAIRDSPDAFGTTAEVASNWSLGSWTQQLATMPTWVAVLGETDVGIVRAERDQDDAAQVWLGAMWVAPQARGRDIGAALMAELVAWARAHSFERVRLEVGAHNHPARRLYERMGFRDTDQRRRLAPPRDHIVECELVYALV